MLVLFKEKHDDFKHTDILGRGYGASVGLLTFLEFQLGYNLI